MINLISQSTKPAKSADSARNIMAGVILAPFGRRGKPAGSETGAGGFVPKKNEPKPMKAAFSVHHDRREASCLDERPMTGDGRRGN